MPDFKLFVAVTTTTLHLIETFATVTYAQRYIVAFRVPIAHKTVDTNYDKSDNCYKISHVLLSGLHNTRWADSLLWMAF
jgi:hypothetical protein